MYRQHRVTASMYHAVAPMLLAAFDGLQHSVPPPALTQVGARSAFRFKEQTLQQAIVLKLARLTTGVQSAWLLLEAGFTQEAGAIERILDEVGSDILFLAGPLTMGVREPSHDKYILEFFQEEFGGEDPVATRTPRDRVRRQKIRAYNARTYSPHEPTDRVVAVLGTIDDTYSGFVHAAGVHTMDTYGGDPLQFHVRGMLDTSRGEDAMRDFRNYLHRALADTAVAAKALGDDKLFSDLYLRSNQLASQYSLV